MKFTTDLTVPALVNTERDLSQLVDVLSEIRCALTTPHQLVAEHLVNKHMWCTTDRWMNEVYKTAGNDKILVTLKLTFVDGQRGFEVIIDNVENDHDQG